MKIRPNTRIAYITTAVIMITAAAYSEDTEKRKTPHLYETPAEKRDIAGIVLMEGISIGGLIEVEASIGEDQGEDISDVVLATFELGVEAIFKDWLASRALLLWEEDDTEPMDLDEAVITLGKSETIPFYLEAGKLYVPFGVFNSHFISDPLVLELAETRESATLVGFANDYLDINFGSFNGNMDNEEEKANDCVASLTLTAIKTVTAGAYWISDIGESDVLEEIILETISSTTNSIAYDRVGGVGGFISIQIGRFVADAEYITALKDFDVGILPGQKPSAWNIETGIHCTKHEIEIALKYEGCNDFFGFPEKQFGIGSSARISDSTTIAIEFLHGLYDNTSEDRNVVTAQLAMEF